MSEEEAPTAIQVNIYFDPALWRRIESASKRLGVSVDAFIGAAAWNACDSTEARAKKAAGVSCSTD